MDLTKTLADPREFRFMQLDLIQPKWSKRSFELRFDDELIATLDWPSWFSNLAVGTTAFGEWTFKRKGIFHPQILVRRKGSKRDLFLLKMKDYRKGTIAIGDRKITWKPISQWKSERGWMEGHRDIMTFKLHYSLSKNRMAKMQIIKTDFSGEELSVLMLTGLYLIHLSAQYGGA